jgi:hypothetical protein
MEILESLTQKKTEYKLCVIVMIGGKFIDGDKLMVRIIF